MEFDSEEQARMAWAEVSPNYNSLNPQHVAVHTAMGRFYGRQFPGVRPDGDTPPQFEVPPPEQQPGAENAEGRRLEAAKILGLVPNSLEDQSFQADAEQFVQTHFKGQENGYLEIGDILESAVGRERALKMFAAVVKTFKS